MSMEDIETRAAQIGADLENASAEEIESMNAEIEALEARKAEIKAEAEARAKAVDEALSDAVVVEEFNEEGKKGMEIKELRNTRDYINAYAEYIKTGEDKELRKVLTENGTAGANDTKYPTPEFIENKIQTAWDNDRIMTRVAKSYLKGNLKIGFEMSSTAAVVHAEGTNAPAEEVLKLGIVELKPENIKKWIHISDEQYALGGEEFLDYIYDEIAYRIVKKAAALVIDAIKACPAASTATQPAVAALSKAAAADTIIEAEALLSGEASDVVAIMNRATWGTFKALKAQNGDNIEDPFDGLEVLFTDALPAYSAAANGDTYMIVGDLRGVRANLPNGDEVKFVFDEKSEAEADLVKVVGKLYAAIGVTAPNKFTQVKKAAA